MSPVAKFGATFGVGMAAGAIGTILAQVLLALKPVVVVAAPAPSGQQKVNG